MLARIQQAITLAAVFLLVAWLTYNLQSQQPMRAVLGVMVGATAHAWVLALEFVLLAAKQDSDAAPRATVRQLMVAWWGEVLSSPRVFCWRQPFRSRRWPDHLPSTAVGRTGLVLVHGFVCNRGLWNAWMRRLTAQGTPFVAVDMEPVFGPIQSGATAIEAAVRRIEQCTGRPPVIVAHSMGGLAVRHWWAVDGNEQRAKHVITLGSPHRGTWLARWGCRKNARQMRLASPWLKDLAARESPATASRFTCFYSHCDNIVFPASTATMTGADNRHLCAVAHVHMVDHPVPWEVVQEHLRPMA